MIGLLDLRRFDGAGGFVSHSSDNLVQAHLHSQRRDLRAPGFPKLGPANVRFRRLGGQCGKVTAHPAHPPLDCLPISDYTRQCGRAWHQSSQEGTAAFGFQRFRFETLGPRPDAGFVAGTIAAGPLRLLAFAQKTIAPVVRKQLARAATQARLSTGAHAVCCGI